MSHHDTEEATPLDTSGLSPCGYKDIPTDGALKAAWIPRAQRNQRVALSIGKQKNDSPRTACLHRGASGGLGTACFEVLLPSCS